MEDKPKFMSSNYNTTRRKYERKLCDLQLSKDILNRIQKAQAIKEKLDKWNTIKQKSAFQKT